MSEFADSIDVPVTDGTPEAQADNSIADRFDALMGTKPP